MSPEIMAEFAALLIQGYEEDLELIISCIDDPIQDNTAYQSYIDTGYGRLMLCYTSKAHAAKETRHLPDGDDGNISTGIAKCRSILDNMFNKSVIIGLVFNSDCQDAFIIPKDIIQIAMLGIR